MKKIKWALLSLTIIFSVCAAFATRPKFDCATLTQYYASGGWYYPTGTYGVDYICEEGTIVCTYTTPNMWDYYPCAIGTYVCCMAAKESAIKPSTSKPLH
jgi:hypothetical protein